MTIEIRPVTAEEMRAFRELVAYVFAASRADFERIAAADPPPDWPRVEPEQTLAAFVDGRLATATAAHRFTVQLNGRPVPAAGVTAVGTYPEFRRQGLLRRTMTDALARYRDAGESFALLWASYAAIYQRYGYGIASAYVGYEFDPRAVALREERPISGRVRLLPDDEARPLAERVRAAWVAPRNLVLEYRPEWWDVTFRQRGERRRYHAIYVDAAGEPRGYLVYDTSEDLGGWGTTGPDQSMEIHGFYPLDEEAHRALWQYVRAHDLVKRVRWGSAPEDDITPDLLLEPSELHRQTGDSMWMRITDVEALLSQRPYGEAGALTLAVRDELLPWNGATFRLESDGDQSEVTRVPTHATRAGGEAEIRLAVAALATLVSGYRSATRLHRAGLLEGEPEALRRADRMFATEYAPHMTDDF